MKKLTILLSMLFLFAVTAPCFAGDISIWFPPDWKEKGDLAKSISSALSEKSGLSIKPRVAKSYPEILSAFSSAEPSLVYVGSFVQAIISAQGIGTPLAQNVDGKELYSSIMIFPKGKNPDEILKTSPEKIAYAKAATSGESGAKAATDGKAAIATPNHGATANAVKSGTASAGFVKNFWWAGNKDKFPELDAYEVPGVSEQKNPDNVLTASKAVSPADAEKIKAAALESSKAFNSPGMVAFSGDLEFSKELMKKGKIDPAKYDW